MTAHDNKVVLVKAQWNSGMWQHLSSLAFAHKQFLIWSIWSEEFYGQGEAAPAQVAQNDALHMQVHQLRWKKQDYHRLFVSAFNMQYSEDLGSAL